jgi:hypothetical protein
VTPTAVETIPPSARPTYQEASSIVSRQAPSSSNSSFGASKRAEQLVGRVDVPVADELDLDLGSRFRELARPHRHPGNALGVREPELERLPECALVARPCLHPRPGACGLDLGDRLRQRLDGGPRILDHPRTVHLWHLKPRTEQDNRVGARSNRAPSITAQSRSDNASRARWIATRSATTPRPYARRPRCVQA